MSDILEKVSGFCQSNRLNSIVLIGNGIIHIKVNRGILEDTINAIKSLLCTDEITEDMYSILYNSEYDRLSIKELEVKNKITEDILREFCNESKIMIRNIAGIIGIDIGKDIITANNNLGALKLWLKVRYNIDLDKENCVEYTSFKDKYILIFNDLQSSLFKTKLTPEIVMDNVYLLDCSFEYTNGNIDIECKNAVQFIVELTRLCNTKYSLPGNDIIECLEVKNNIIKYRRK